MPVAPGTWGSLPPCLFVLVLIWVGAPDWVVHLLLLSVIVLGSIACVRLGPWAERLFSGKDPGAVVIDEVAGMALTMLFVPLHPLGSDAPWGAMVVVGGAFVLFRIFDVVKPPPANSMQQFPSGWGILLDDLVAGVFANLTLQAFLRIGLPVLVAGG